jgi:hypothetical protein
LDHPNDERDTLRWWGEKLPRRGQQRAKGRQTDHKPIGALDKVARQIRLFDETVIMPPIKALNPTQNNAPPQNQAAEKRAFGVLTISPARKKISLAKMKLVMDVMANVFMMPP